MKWGVLIALTLVLLAPGAALAEQENYYLGPDGVPHAQLMFNPLGGEMPNYDRGRDVEPELLLQRSSRGLERTTNPSSALADRHRRAAADGPPIDGGVERGRHVQGSETWCRHRVSPRLDTTGSECDNLGSQVATIDAAPVRRGSRRLSIFLRTTIIRRGSPPPREDRRLVCFRDGHDLRLWRRLRAEPSDDPLRGARASSRPTSQRRHRSRQEPPIRRWASGGDSGATIRWSSTRQLRRRRSGRGRRPWWRPPWGSSLLAACSCLFDQAGSARAPSGGRAAPAGVRPAGSRSPLPDRRSGHSWRSTSEPPAGCHTAGV